MPDISTLLPKWQNFVKSGHTAAASDRWGTKKCSKFDASIAKRRISERL